MTSPAEILSQDEVDALLKGVNGEPVEQAEEALPRGAVRPYNLANPQRTVNSRMPALEIINDNFVRQVRPALYGFMRRNPDITADAVKVHKFSDFLSNLAVPTNINIVQMTSLKGMGLMVFEPGLVFSVVDSLFGGDGRYHVRIEGRDFTATESRIIDKLLALVIENYEKAWKPVYPMAMEFVRSEMNTHFANIVSPNDLVMTTRFNIEMGNAGGAIHVCLPYASLEPIRDTLSNLRTGNSDNDTRWRQLLTRQIQMAEVELTAPLARIRLNIGDVIKLKAGDVIGMDLTDTLDAEVEGVPLMRCRYGASSGKYALKVIEMLSPHTAEEQSGE
jgi:flagellar motor switch protein FliM